MLPKVQRSLITDRDKSLIDWPRTPLSYTTTINSHNSSSSLWQLSTYREGASTLVCDGYLRKEQSDSPIELEQLSVQFCCSLVFEHRVNAEPRTDGSNLTAQPQSGENFRADIPSSSLPKHVNRTSRLAAPSRNLRPVVARAAGFPQVPPLDRPRLQRTQTIN